MNNEEVIKKYHFFIMKYHKLISKGYFDYKNYDIKIFLCCYISEEELRRNLKRGKFHSKEIKEKVDLVIKNIRKGFSEYDIDRNSENPKDELYNELVCILLECHKNFKENEIGFEKYLYKSFRYKLKRICDKKMQQVIIKQKSDPYKEDMAEEKMEMEDEIDFLYNNRLFLNGINCEFPFEEMSYLERFILVKYYVNEMTDKEIAKECGYHPKYINFLRNKLLKELRRKRKNGMFKWMR
jgi:RNA polymerase sigma factor (sigma-70 family)